MVKLTKPFYSELVGYIFEVWQSRIETKYCSVAYFNRHIQSLYHQPFVKGGSYSICTA